MQTLPMAFVVLSAFVGSVGQAQTNVHVGTPTVTAGHLTVDQIKQVVTQNVATFRKCYADGQARKPGLFGLIQVAFNINGTTGAVMSARQGSATTMSESDTVKCVTNAFMTFKFPTTDNGAAVLASVPMTFSTH